MLVLLLICLTACMATEYRIATETIPVRIGETTIELVIHEAEEPGLTYFVLHENERTAAEAALDVIRRNGGRLIEISHTQERNVSFKLGDERYVFDPNRVFTEAGRVATLADLSKVSPEALDALEQFADTVLEVLATWQEDFIITVHNNTRGEYSTFSYVNDAQFVRDAMHVHVADREEPDNFFFVTEPDLFDSIRSAGFNVVLQDNANATDDGSLSVYAGNRGIPYVNVEAEHGQFESQVRMLEFLNDRLFREQIE